MEEIKLMKGNEAFAHAAVRSGCDGYFGYPITPQSEVMETLQELNLGKKLVWWFFKQRAKCLQSTWFMLVLHVVKKL